MGIQRSAPTRWGASRVSDSSSSPAGLSSTAGGSTPPLWTAEFCGPDTPWELPTSMRYVALRVVSKEPSFRYARA